MKGGLLGALIGAGTGLIGTGINAIMGARKARAEQRALAKAERENQQWYDRRYNEVGRERADAQRLLTRMREAQSDRMSRAAGANAVVGGSSARVASEQAAANKAVGDTISQIDAAQEARRDKIEGQYLSRKDNLRNARMRSLAADKANLANAATQAGLIGANIAASAIGGDANTGTKTLGQAAAARAKSLPATDKDGVVGASSVRPAGTTGTTGANEANDTTAGEVYNPYASVWSLPELQYNYDPRYGTTMSGNLLNYWRNQG